MQTVLGFTDSLPRESEEEKTASGIFPFLTVRGEEAFCQPEREKRQRHG